MEPGRQGATLETGVSDRDIAHPPSVGQPQCSQCCLFCYWKPSLGDVRTCLRKENTWDALVWEAVNCCNLLHPSLPSPLLPPSSRILVNPSSCLRRCLCRKVISRALHYKAKKLNSSPKIKYFSYLYLMVLAISICANCIKHLNHAMFRLILTLFKINNNNII